MISAVSSAPRYRPEVLEALGEHGLAPHPESAPDRVRIWLRDLYNFELREANHRYREASRVLGPQPLEAQRKRVEALRGRYWLLSLPVQHWLERR
jgi:hypothetical protein